MPELQHLELQQCTPGHCKCTLELRQCTTQLVQSTPHFPSEVQSTQNFLSEGTPHFQPDLLVLSTPQFPSELPKDTLFPSQRLVRGMLELHQTRSHQ